jgi:hypothetical protein
LRHDGASPHREEPPQGGVSNGETAASRPPQDEENCARQYDFTSS